MVEVDEDNLLNIESSLITKRNNNSLERQRITDAQRNLEEIKLVKLPDPTIDEPTKTKLVLPNDVGLGIEITVERREARYDKLLADFAAL